MGAVAAGRAWLRVAAWLSLCAVALWVLLRGQSDLYMAANVRWTLWLAVLASLGIAGLDGYAAWRHGARLSLPRAGWFGGRRLLMLPGWLAAKQRRRGASYALVFLPMAVGIAIPPAIFGTQSVLDNASAVTLLAPPALAQAALPATPRVLSLLQLQDHLQGGALPAGSLVRVSGFVVHLNDLPPHAWLLVRFITPHCVAEAHPLAVLVQQTSGKTIPNDTWVTVTGALHSGTAEGQLAAIIADPQIAAIAMPLDPYLVY